MTTLAAHGLRRSFLSGDVRTDVVASLSVAVAPGELTLVSGPSGCGKSTLLALLSGLDRPDEGEVHALGIRLSALDTHEREQFRLRHTGFVFQGFNLFPALSAWEQVALPLHYLGLPPAEIRKRADDALAEVGMAGRAHVKPAALSGGEKQRVAIARATAKRPELLFADEPTSALDAHNGQVVIQLLRESAHLHGTTILCVSHDPRLEQRADRVLSMEDGRILRDWRPEGAEAVP
jgi:putative ABC transport system ATP-binding protein